MMKFQEKVKRARSEFDLTQQELADLVGVSKRSIAAYEAGIKPRSNVARKLAKTLKTSVDYLLNDEIEDPDYGKEKAPYIEEAYTKYSEKAARNLNVLLEQNTALFTEGTLSEEAKNAFFQAVIKAYLACKDAARDKYGNGKKE
jgi:DNA-binding XRE family transcriptional regulator